MEKFRIPDNTRCFLGVEEFRVSAPSGLSYLLITLHGEFWGFEQNNAHHIWEYLEEKAELHQWILINISHLSLFTDNGPVLIRELTTRLNRKNGDAAVCSPMHPNIKQVLDIAGWEYFETEAEAVAHFEEQVR